MEPAELCGTAGLGRERAAQVLAALELARRAHAARDLRPRLRTAGEVYRYLAPRLTLLRREVFHVLCFNTRNVLLSDARVAEGTTDASPSIPESSAPRCSPGHRGGDRQHPQEARPPTPTGSPASCRPGRSSRVWTT
jgi:DNA repair protein RadC